MSDLETAQVVLELVEFRLPRGAVGVELALDAAELGIERNFGMVARGSQSSFDVRANFRLDRCARCVGLLTQARGFVAGFLGGVARMIELPGKVTRSFGGLTARVVGGAGSNFPAQLRKRQLDFYGLQVLDRIGVENQ